MDATNCYGPCSGHGDCQYNNVTQQAVCICSTTGKFDPSTNCAKCLTGWAGYGCNQCDTDYFGGNCTKCPMDPSGNVCGGRGTCFDGLNGNGTCSCEAGFLGAMCDQCAEGFFGPDCTACPNCNKGVCNDVRTAWQTALLLVTCAHTPCPLASETCRQASVSVSFSFPPFPPPPTPPTPNLPCRLCPCFCVRIVAMQGLNGNGVCSCNPNFVDPDCKCLTEKTVGNTTVCESCPAGYGGDSCVVCPGSTVTPNGTVTSWCSGHGQCPITTGGAAGGPAACKCEDPHQGVDCSECFDGYVPIVGQTCAKCPGLVNPADSGAYSGGKVLVSCFYKGLCNPASDNSTAQCTSCSPGWSGSNCCLWTGGSSPIVIIPAVTLAVLIVLAIAIINGKNNVKWTLLLFSPTLQVRCCCVCF
jgi:hypothetical protein